MWSLMNLEVILYLIINLHLYKLHIPLSYSEACIVVGHNGYMHMIKKALSNIKKNSVTLKMKSAADEKIPDLPLKVFNLLFY